jgi:hypothetical protein
MGEQATAAATTSFRVSMSCYASIGSWTYDGWDAFRRVVLNPGGGTMEARIAPLLA